MTSATTICSAASTILPDHLPATSSDFETGADALIPIRTLPDDYYEHDSKRHALIGRRWGREYHLGEHHPVRLVEANGQTGSLIAEIMEGEAEGTKKRSASRTPAPRRGARGKAAARPSGQKPSKGGPKGGRRGKAKAKSSKKRK